MPNARNPEADKRKRPQLTTQDLTDPMRKALLT